MTDLGPEEMDAWANRHPRLARTIMVGSVWAVLQGAAFLFASLGIEPVGGFFTGVANLMLLIWCGVLLYMNREHAGPAIGRFWDGVVEQVLIIVSRQTLRTYRFAGERAAHEEQARETTISLGLMAQAAADDPTQVRMASDIEHGAEARLSVLLGKPQLSLAEKRERDAIQMALQARRAGFDTAPAVAPAPRPMGFVSLAAPSLPIGWIVAGVAAIAFAVQGWFLGKATHERDEAIEAAEQMAASNARLTEALGDASQAHTIDTERRIEQVRNEMEAIALERERAARRAAQRRERNALENDPSLGPIDFGQRLPNLVEPASADGGGDGEPASPDPVGDVPG